MTNEIYRIEYLKPFKNKPVFVRYKDGDYEKVAHGILDHLDERVIRVNDQRAGLIIIAVGNLKIVRLLWGGRE